MMFHFGLKSSLLLLFFTHGLIFALLLLNMGWRQGSRSSCWLSLLIFLCSLYISPFMLGYAGWYARDGYREVLFYLPLQQLLLIGPVLYFYTKSLLDPAYDLQRKDLIHFLPAAVYLLYAIVVFVVDVLIVRAPYFYADGRDKDLAPWYQVAGLGSMLVYFSLSLRHYRRYKKLAFDVLSFADTVLYRWVERYLLALVTILLLRILFFLLNPEWGEFGSKFWYYLCFSVLFYYISITGYTHAVRMQSLFWTLAPGSGPAPTMQTLEAAGSFEPAGESDATSQILPDLDAWKAELEKLMQEENVYQNPGLTLLDVAAALNTTPRQVSQIVNQGFELNFNDFVNHYRTLALLRKFEAMEHQSKTLLALALECGFNSKSTFNRAFKKHTGTTPKDYLEKGPDKGVKT